MSTFSFSEAFSRYILSPPKFWTYEFVQPCFLLLVILFMYGLHITSLFVFVFFCFVFLSVHYIHSIFLHNHISAALTISSHCFFKVIDSVNCCSADGPSPCSPIIQSTLQDRRQTFNLLTPLIDRLSDWLTICQIADYWLHIKCSCQLSHLFITVWNVEGYLLHYDINMSN